MKNPKTILTVVSNDRDFSITKKPMSFTEFVKLAYKGYKSTYPHRDNFVDVSPQEYPDMYNRIKDELSTSQYTIPRVEHYITNDDEEAKYTFTLKSNPERIHIELDIIYI